MALFSDFGLDISSAVNLLPVACKTFPKSNIGLCIRTDRKTKTARIRLDPGSLFHPLYLHPLTVLFMKQFLSFRLRPPEDPCQRSRRTTADADCTFPAAALFDRQVSREGSVRHQTGKTDRSSVFFRDQQTVFPDPTKPRSCSHRFVRKGCSPVIVCFYNLCCIGKRVPASLLQEFCPGRYDFIQLPVKSIIGIASVWSGAGKKLRKSVFPTPL